MVLAKSKLQNMALIPDDDITNVLAGIGNLKQGDRERERGKKETAEGRETGSNLRNSKLI